MILYRATNRFTVGTTGCLGTIVYGAVALILLGVVVYAALAAAALTAAWAILWAIPRALWGTRIPRVAVAALLASWYLVLSFAVIILIGALP